MTVGLGLALASIVSLGPDPRLDWDAPLECPDGRWVADRIGAYLGHPLADEAEVRVVAHVRAQAAGFVLDLDTEVGELRDRQQVVHYDCAALVEIAASLAAISIDPLAHGSGSMDAPIPTHSAAAPFSTDPSPGVSPPVVLRPTPPAPAAPRVPSPPTPAPEQPLLGELHADPEVDAEEPEPDPERRTRLAIGASAGLALALFPAPAPEVRANIGVERGGPRAAVRGELLGGVIPTGRFRTADGLSGGDLLAWDLGLRGCGGPRFSFVELRVCAAVGGGQIRARGVNVEPALTRSHPWVWVNPELGLAFELSRRVALFVDLGANLNVYRPRFSISNPDASFVTPVASARTRLGVELRFF